MSLSPDTAPPMNAEQRQLFFSRLHAANPNPVTELVYNNPFELLIAVLLSAQATDVSVNRATRTLFKQAPTPAAMLVLGRAGIEAHIQHIGLFRNKAQYIMATCQLLIDCHQGEVPATRAALEALPGVGRKTANVVLNTAFGQSVMAVDTHVFRVANRTGLAPAATVLAVETQLMQRIPNDFLYHAHHWLILHGRYTCRAKKPQCHTCIVADVCQFQSKTTN